MDDCDFYEALLDDGPRKRAGTEFLRKHAGVADTVRSAGRRTVDFIKTYPHEIAGALLMAGGVSAAQYASSRPGKNGELSPEQKLFRRGVDASLAAEKETIEGGKKMSFPADLAGATAKGLSHIADANAKHPVAAAILAGSTLSPIGWKLISRFKR